MSEAIVAVELLHSLTQHFLGMKQILNGELSYPENFQHFRRHFGRKLVGRIAKSDGAQSFLQNSTFLRRAQIGGQFFNVNASWKIRKNVQEILVIYYVFCLPISFQSNFPAFIFSDGTSVC